MYQMLYGQSRKFLILPTMRNINLAEIEVSWNIRPIPRLLMSLSNKTTSFRREVAFPMLNLPDGVSSHVGCPILDKSIAISHM
jgi:hypothetical protein